MATGKVKWFNIGKGYGFIIPDDGTPDVFLAVRSIKGTNLPRLETGMALRYSIGGKGGRAFAEHVSIIQPAELDPRSGIPATEPAPMSTEEFEQEWGLRR